MDFEEFLLATKDEGFIEIIKNLCTLKKPLGNLLQKLSKEFKLYMAVGGMPQAIDTYIKTNNFFDTDDVKRKIIELYQNDFYKIDPKGKISSIFSSIPSQLLNSNTKFSITKATGKQKIPSDADKIFNLIDSKTVLPCYRISDPYSPSLSQCKKNDTFKLYLADTGLFVTMLFSDKENPQKDIYKKLINGKTNLNLGYLYENITAQMLTSLSYDLYYYTWQKENSTHNYEIDFLLPKNGKITPIEVKSSSINHHKSIDEFTKKFHKQINNSYIVSMSDLKTIDRITNIPIFFLPFIG